jgi:hypothetical protein
MTPKSKGPNLTFSGRLAQPSRKRTRGRHALSLIWNYRPGSRKAGAVPSRADERLWLGRSDTPSAPITYHVLPDCIALNGRYPSEYRIPLPSTSHDRLLGKQTVSFRSACQHCTIFNNSFKEALLTIRNSHYRHTHKLSARWRVIGTANPAPRGFVVSSMAPLGAICHNRCILPSNRTREEAIRSSGAPAAAALKAMARALPWTAHRNPLAADP